MLSTRRNLSDSTMKAMPNNNNTTMNKFVSTDFHGSNANGRQMGLEKPILKKSDRKGSGVGGRSKVDRTVSFFNKRRRPSGSSSPTPLSLFRKGKVRALGNRFVTTGTTSASTIKRFRKHAFGTGLSAIKESKKLESKPVHKPVTVRPVSNRVSVKRKPSRSLPANLNAYNTRRAQVSRSVNVKDMVNNYGIVNNNNKSLKSMNTGGSGREQELRRKNSLKSWSKNPQLVRQRGKWAARSFKNLRTQFAPQNTTQTKRVESTKTKPTVRTSTSKNASPYSKSSLRHVERDTLKRKKKKKKRTSKKKQSTKRVQKNTGPKLVYDDVPIEIANFLSEHPEISSLQQLKSMLC